MSVKQLPLYDGALNARQIGAFLMNGEEFKVVRPGYCIQGKRRTTWTQIVHEDVPVYEFKIQGDVAAATARFSKLWQKYIGGDRAVMLKALENCKKERRKKFRDGTSGEVFAPSVTQDGRGEGHRYIK